MRLLDSIDACLPHPNEAIQEQASKGLRALISSYFPVSLKGPSDRLQKRVVDKYVKQVKTSINPAATRGFTRALGCLPRKLLAPSSKVLDLCLSCLCRISRPDATIGNEKDAETRRNSLVALARICETVGITSNESEVGCVVGLSPKQVGHVFTALCRGLDDYNMERRGDVGSMCRIASMKGLVSVALITTKHHDLAEDYFPAATSRRLVGGLLKQLAEKLDAVRSEAGKCLTQVLTQSDPPIPHIEQRDHFLRALGLEQISEPSNEPNWADAAVTFPAVSRALDIHEYFQSIVSGLVISVGCLTQSVSKQASSALVQWVKEAHDDQIDRLGKGKPPFTGKPIVTLVFSTFELPVLLNLFVIHRREGRVILPLLKTISLLMNRMCIDRLLRDSDFSAELLSHLVEEEKDCKDIHRLNASVDVALGMLSGGASKKVGID